MDRHKNSENDMKVLLHNVIILLLAIKVVYQYVIILLGVLMKKCYMFLVQLYVDCI